MKNKKTTKLIYKNSANGSAVVHKSSRQPNRKLSSIYKVNNSLDPKLSSKDKLGFTGTALSVVMIFLLMLVVMRFLLVPNAPVYTFESLLEVLQGTPNMLPWSNFIDLTIYADWGVFEFFRSFLNSITGIIEFLLWVTNLITYTLQFIGYYLSAFFNIVMF